MIPFSADTAANDDPIIVRRTMGRALRTLRDLAGLTGRELAKTIGISQARVSRIESGTTAPSNHQLHAWAKATGADQNTTDQLLDLNKRAHTPLAQHPPLRNIEVRAGSIYIFDPVGIPALLWTPLYARQILQAAHGQGHDDAAFIEELQRRQQTLLTGHKHCEFILTESALPAPTSPANRGQLGHLLSLEGIAKITLIPNHCPPRAFAKTAFTIYDDFGDDTAPLVSITTIHAELTVTTTHDVTRYRAMFDQLTAHTTEIDWSLSHKAHVRDKAFRAHPER